MVGTMTPARRHAIVGEWLRAFYERVLRSGTGELLERPVTDTDYAVVRSAV